MYDIDAASRAILWTFFTKKKTKPKDEGNDEKFVDNIFCPPREKHP